MTRDPSVLMVSVLGAILLAVLVAGALRLDLSPDPSDRMNQCLAAGISYQAEFGWDPDGGIRAWCERNITGK